MNQKQKSQSKDFEIDNTKDETPAQNINSNFINSSSENQNAKTKHQQNIFSKEIQQLGTIYNSYRVIFQFYSTSNQFNQQNGTALNEQGAKSKEYVSIQQNDKSIKQNIEGNQELLKQNSGYQSAQDDQDIQQYQDQDQELVIRQNTLLLCQYAFIQVLRQMIYNSIITSSDKLQDKKDLDVQISIYCQLRGILKGDDLKTMKEQEEELLQFFEDWFEDWFDFEEEISQIQNNKIDKQEIKNIIQSYFQEKKNLEFEFDFEIECLNYFFEYIRSKKQEDLKKLKELYSEEETLNNWKNIKDQIKANKIQIFVMFLKRKERDPQDKLVQYYIKWWFQWNKTCVFKKAQQEANKL
ncbi:unnamed protein product [Paramecium sonneborni]|uniref:Uncharacterized protein n=1 Tax=Paramecium sonneborni TaxID=65129 RepID=A0A8S1NA13_9CILI|nr:unnamed protein product [Paramecium sonneborni]